jgi:hypothetical protein
MQSILLLVVACVAFAWPVAGQVATSGPILPSERATTQPSRAVPARAYRDAYCASWTDGCETCETKAAGEEPTCVPTRGAQAGVCERTPVECRAMLKTIGRVCLTYRDGCNVCAGGSCTLMACSTRLPDGTSRPKELDFQCTGPRRTRYDDPKLIRLDLRGHWRLTDPHGRTCEIVVGFGVQLTPDCIALGSPVTQIRDARMSGAVFLLTTFDGSQLLSFDTSNLDDLPGNGSSDRFRLTRLEAEPMDPRNWEGGWQLHLRSVPHDAASTRRTAPSSRRRENSP